MFDLAITDKLIEQGGIVLGIVIAIVILKMTHSQNKEYLAAQDKHNKEYLAAQLKVTEKVTTALVKSSESSEKLASVLDKNLQKMDNIVTKNDLEATEGRLIREYEKTQKHVQRHLKNKRSTL